MDSYWRGWFLNFVGVSLIFHLNNNISYSKCKQKLAYNVNGVIYVVKLTAGTLLRSKLLAFQRQN
jgi:hypothetical protein